MAIPSTTRIPKLITQWRALKKDFPDSTGGVRQNQLRWIATLQPNPLCAAYRIRLEYSLERTPKVFVEDPALQPREGQQIPHQYRNKSLCLYLPKANEWNSQMYLVDTIVPWTSEWLYHYELWHATGDWHGGGVHPFDTQKIPC
jgi:hypothetical protein